MGLSNRAKHALLRSALSAKLKTFEKGRQPHVQTFPYKPVDLQKRVLLSLSDTGASSRVARQPTTVTNVLPTVFLCEHLWYTASEKWIK